MYKKLAVDNTSGVTGVCFLKGCKRWRAAIQIDGETVILYMGVSFDKAVAARRKAEWEKANA